MDFGGLSGDLYPFGNSRIASSYFLPTELDGGWRFVMTRQPSRIPEKMARFISHISFSKMTVKETRTAEGLEYLVVL